MARNLTSAMLCLLAACGSDGSGAESPMLEPYLAIGTALAADETQNTASQAENLLTALEKQPNVTGGEELAAGLAELRVASDLAAARQAFKEVSQGVIGWMRADPAIQTNYMIVHCPMTFDSQGADWVQARGQIMNPYEGSRMLHCGSVVDWNPPTP